MKIYHLSLCAVLLISGMTTATAQMRAGQPETLAPTPRAPDPALVILGQFQTAYRNAGSPRLMVMWNKDFTDELSSEYEDRTTKDATRSDKLNEIEKSTAGPSGDVRTLERDNIEKEMSEEVAGTKRVRSKRPDMAPEPVMWQMEQAFVQTLVAAGVDVIDRNTAMRLTGMAQNVGERDNIQELETRALSENADILIEVLQTPDKRAPNGATFRITARDLRTARLLGTSLSSGTPPNRQMPLVAGPNGFERARQAKPNPSQIGSQLAMNIMASLSVRWQ